MALANQVFKISWQWLASGFSGSKNSSFIVDPQFCVVDARAPRAAEIFRPN